MLKFFLVAHLTYETSGVSCETKFGLLVFLGHPSADADADDVDDGDGDDGDGDDGND